MPDTALKIAVPKAWVYLLKVDDFTEMARVPERWRGCTPGAAEAHSSDKTPFRYDSRQVRHVDVDHVILVKLTSDGSKYSYTVTEEGATPSKGVFSKIPAKIELKLASGSELNLEIVTE